MISILFTSFLFSASVVLAQSNDDSLANILVRRHIAINSAKMSMPGYRVQIYYGSQRAKASEMRTEFMKKFPGVPAYLFYQQPNFKVRLGDFKTRLEAMKLLEEIKNEYSSAFIVKDEVKLPE